MQNEILTATRKGCNPDNCWKKLENKIYTTHVLYIYLLNESIYFPLSQKNCIKTQRLFNNSKWYHFNCQQNNIDKIGVDRHLSFNSLVSAYVLMHEWMMMEHISRDRQHYSARDSVGMVIKELALYEAFQLNVHEWQLMCYTFEGWLEHPPAGLKSEMSVGQALMTNSFDRSRMSYKQMPNGLYHMTSKGENESEQRWEWEVKIHVRNRTSQFLSWVMHNQPCRAFMLPLYVSIRVIIKCETSIKTIEFSIIWCCCEKWDSDNQITSYRAVVIYHCNVAVVKFGKLLAKVSPIKCQCYIRFFKRRRYYEISDAFCDVSL